MNKIKLRKLEAIFQNRNIDKPPKGFKTREAWTKEWKISSQYCGKLLHKYLAKNLMEIKMFKVKSGQVTRPIPHYRIKNENRQRKT